VKVDLRGQIAPLWEILRGLSIGLGVSLAVILLVLTAAFQSLRLAVVALAAAPAVLAGVALALRLTGTTVNLQSFMGAIMALGIGVANSILVVTFAELARTGGADTARAALDGGSGRLRAVMMTAAAMIAGMLPLALGMGEAAEQNAPLGRAVIGGLAFATMATLTVVPVFYAILQRGAARTSRSLDPTDPTSRYYEPV